MNTQSLSTSPKFTSPPSPSSKNTLLPLFPMQNQICWNTHPKNPKLLSLGKIPSYSIGQTGSIELSYVFTLHSTLKEFIQWNGYKVGIFMESLSSIVQDKFTCGPYQAQMNNVRVVFQADCSSQPGKNVQLSSIIEIGSDSESYLKTIHSKKLDMKAFRLTPNLLLIQADNILLYIKDRVVSEVFKHEGDLMITGNIAMWVNNGKINAYTMQEEMVTAHGECEGFEGHYFGASIHDNTLMMLFYEFKELKVRVIHLVDEEENIKYVEEKEEKKKFKDNLNIAALQKHKSKSDRPKHDDPYRSEVHSASTILQGRNLRQALKASIGKFKEEFDKSLEQEKFSFKEGANLQSGSYYQLGSEGVEKREEESSRKQVLRQQQFDQHEVSGHNSNIASNNSYLLTQNNHPSDIAETPGFTFQGHDWSHFQKGWMKSEEPSPSIKQSIPIIKEEVENNGLLSNQTSHQGSSIANQKKTSRQRTQNNVIQAIEQNLTSSIDHSHSKVIDNPQAIEVKPFNHSNRKILESKDLDQLFMESCNLDQRMQSSLMSSMNSNRSNKKKRILQSSFIEEIPLFQSPVVINQENWVPFPQEPTFKNISTNEPKPTKQLNLPQAQDDGKSKKESNSFQNKSTVIKPIVVPVEQKYTQMLRSIFRTSPENFDQELERNMSQIIKEKEARLFFAQYIRTFNQEMTKDKLLRLYRTVQDNEENRLLMTKALSQFKLEEVPIACLPFSESFLDIFQKIYPEVYIEDLLEPSIRLMSDLIRLYFKGDFKEELILIEDLKVELKYVRNFLNILLYLNEQFKLPLETIFEVYSKEALKNHHIEVVKRIKNGKIPSLCGVSPTIFSDGAEKAITELLQQKITDFKLVEQIIPILEPKSRNLYSDIVNLSEELSVCQIVFEGSALLEMVRTKNSLSFMKDIIENNHCSDLVKLDMTFALKMIEKIKQNRSDNYFNSQGIEIIKLLAQKLIENGYVKDCFKNLSPIASILKRSYIAGLLIKYNEGKYANRLANVKLYTTKDFTSLFTEILKGQKGLKRGDTMPTTVPSQFAIKNWDQFNKLCSTLLAIQSWELNYLIYTDIQLARELVEEGVISKGEFEACCKVLGYFMSINNRIVSTKKIEDPIIKFGSQSIPSNNSSGQLLTVHERLKRKTKKRRSLRESKNSGSNQLLSKSLYQAESQTDPVLFDIKFEVVPTETIKILRQYYQQPPIQEFFNAIKLVDYQKIGLSIANINIFKSLYLLDLQFNFKSLVPFKYFFSREDAWMEIVEVITGIINLDNFWVIMLLVDLLYEKATEVVQIIIAKIVKYEKNDSWAPVIQKVLQEVNIEPMFLREIAKEAEERGLMDILSVLNKNI